MIDRESLPLLDEAAAELASGFAALPGYSPAVDADRLRVVLAEAATGMRDNYPYTHPLYAGQMLKPPHPISRLAYALSLWINPNNHALDGGRASSAMEKEAVAQLAGMFGWRASADGSGFLGHLCGGGTMANLEALWVAREVAGKGSCAAESLRLLASEQAHYTHRRLCGVLGVPFTAVPTDDAGRMDADTLEAELERGDVCAVVATLGTTAIGSCDPLPDIMRLRNRYGFRLHCDAAYGGYYTLAADYLLPQTSASYEQLGEADSIVVDPHKHGLQPYGCGCVLFRDPAVGRVYRHDSPYTYFTSDELHLGEISLECSRPGAAAVALWATQRLLPLVHGGEFATMLRRCRSAALELYRRVSEDTRFVGGPPPELDIVVWAPRAATTAEASERSRAIFQAAADRDLHLALATLPARFFGDTWAAEGRAATVTCLRSCLMKPDHADWLDAIWERLDAAASV